MSDETFELKIGGLEHLIKALKARPPTVRIGILGSTARAPKKGQNHAPSNATIGAVHEFGSPARGIPQRSFLRVPLSDHLQDELEKSGLLDKETLKKVVETGSMTPWIKQVAVCAEAVVDDAFESSGFGKWPPWKDPNYKNEGGMLLVDSGQLRDAVTSEVVE